MAAFVFRRILIFFPFLALVSAVSFVVIQLPRGNYVDTYIANLELQGGTVNAKEKASLEAQYGLDKPLPVRYLTWIENIVLHGDFGNSFQYHRPVVDLLKERIPRTMAISLASILLTWLLAVPIGILSAVKQYSVWDQLFTLISFVGLAVPSFLLALLLMYVVYAKTGWLISGLFSPEYRDAPWSIARIVDLLHNVWLPVLVLAVTNTAPVIRVLRGSLLDELKKQYVTTARAKGLPEWRLILRYPVRLAINPLISTIGWLLPAAVGGEVVVSEVLNIPTTGPMLFQAIQARDVYLTGAVVLILSILTIAGTLLSDILLAVVDPRIRYN